MSSMCIWLVPWTHNQQWSLAVLAQLRWSTPEKDRALTCPTWSLTRLTTCESCLTTLLAAVPQNGLVSLQRRSVSMRNGSLMSSAHSGEQGCIEPNDFSSFVKDDVPRNLLFRVPDHCASAARSLKFCCGAWVLIPLKIFLCSSSDVTSSILGAQKLLFYWKWAAKQQNIKRSSITRKVMCSNKYTAINNPWEEWRSSKRPRACFQERSCILTHATLPPGLKRVFLGCHLSDWILVDTEVRLRCHLPDYHRPCGGLHGN